MAASVYTAREREATSIPIHDVLRDGEIDILPDVQGRDYFDIRFQGDKLRVTAGKYVGLIPLNDRVFIQVEPKMPVANLLAVLAAVEGDLVELTVLEREYRVATTAPPKVIVAMANAFVAALRRIETEGLKKAYQGISERGSAPKGQIQFHRSIEQFWSHGTAHAAVYEYFDLTADLAENRLLRYAAHVLLMHHRAAGLLPMTAQALAHFEELFGRADVRLERPALLGLRLESRRGESPHYERALRLAGLIVKGHGVELPGEGSDVALPSFLVNMESLFESYVRHVLALQLGNVEVLDGNRSGSKPLFDDRKSPPANPDIVIRQASGEWLLVAEVKYKIAENRDDINQVLAYALAYRVRRVVLVLPADSESDRGLAVIGEIQGIQLFRYRVNLAAGDLRREEQQLGDAIRAVVAV